VARSVRAGQEIKLRTRFRDDLGDIAEASGVVVHIYDPTETIFDISDPSNAIVISGVATYLGEGIYEYPYTPPAIDGIWYDLWQGELTDQTVSGLCSFEVSADGSVSCLSSQLANNNVVHVEIPSGIQPLTGEGLQELYEFDFMTTTSPAYSSIRKVRLEIGAFVRNLYDDVLQTAILEASLETDVLTFYTTDQNTAVYQHARREYVTCAASSIVLNNIASGVLRSKTLADLHVEYDSTILHKNLDRLYECMARWEPQIIAGGLAKATAQPKGVVKGEYDPDRPVFSRLWASTDTGEISRRVPAANTRERPVGKRRYLRTYKKRWW
jgi:hypothetical protein